MITYVMYKSSKVVNGQVKNETHFFEEHVTYTIRWESGYGVTRRTGSLPSNGGVEQLSELTPKLEALLASIAKGLDSQDMSEQKRAFQTVFRLQRSVTSRELLPEEVEIVGETNFILR